MKNEFKDFRKRTNLIGYGLEGFGTFNLHHFNNKTNVVSVASDNELLIKYEHFDMKDHTNLCAILHGVKDNEIFELTTFNVLPTGNSMDTKVELTQDDFFNKADRLYTLIEAEPISISHIITYDLYKKYFEYRKFMESQVRDTNAYDWTSEELLDFFNNELWENRESSEDPADIEMDMFLELDRLYNENKKNDPSKPWLRLVK